MQAAYKLGGLTVDGVALGSGQAVVKLGNLDGVAVKQLADTYNQMMRQAVAGASDEGLKDEQVQTLIDTATKLLAAKPTFSMDPISWKTAKGESKLTFALDLASPTNLKDLTPQEILVQAIKRIDANLVVSKPMVQDLVAQYMVKTEGKAADKAATEAEEQVRSMAGMAEMFNVGKNDGDNIIGKFHFSDGMGDLNGKKIPADELFSGLLDAAGSHDSMDDDESEPAVGAISSDTDPPPPASRCRTSTSTWSPPCWTTWATRRAAPKATKARCWCWIPAAPARPTCAWNCCATTSPRVLRPGHHRHVQRQEAGFPQGHQRLEQGIPLEPRLPGREEPGRAANGRERGRRDRQGKPADPAEHLHQHRRGLLGHGEQGRGQVNVRATLIENPPGNWRGFS